jgi:CubicO group peptidase (beta-lactamase class C family)
MQRRELIPAAMAVGAWLAPIAARVVSPATPLAPTLLPYLRRYDLPAVAVAVVAGGTIIAAGAVGTRRAGFDSPVTERDAFAIGSDTKAMTALIAAILVEREKLGWETTVGEVFPELAGSMDSGLKNVTLVQLLSHTSGLPSDNDAFIDLVDESYAEDGLNLDELRYWLVKKWSVRPLQSLPGKRFAYSNMGYTLVGAILERRGKSAWEEMIVDEVFTPFGFATAGLGPAPEPIRSKP